MKVTTNTYYRNFGVHSEYSKNQENYEVKRIKILELCVKNVKDVLESFNLKLHLIQETDFQKELDILSGKVRPDNSITYVPRWPLIFFLFSVIICLGFSALFHLM